MSNMQRAAPKSDTPGATLDLERIEKVIEITYEDLLKKGGRFKVSELLKAIELKRKLAPADDREKQFWNMINGIRHDTLAQKQKKPIGSPARRPDNNNPHAE